MSAVNEFLEYIGFLVYAEGSNGAYVPTMDLEQFNQSMEWGKQDPDQLENAKGILATLLKDTWFYSLVTGRLDIKGSAGESELIAALGVSSGGIR